MEKLLMPFESVSSIKAAKAIVLAPHPDDEVFGCGGAIMSHVENHTPVRVIIVTDGGYGPANEEERQAYVLRRREECRQAANVLGYGEPVFWDFPDRALTYGESLVAQFMTAFHEYEADLVYAPSLHEIHPDHRAVAMAAVESVRRCERTVRLAMYEVGSPLRPNVLLDITRFLERKRQAMRCSSSQILMQAYDTQIEALNRYRTYTLPKSVISAEAFMIIDNENIKTNYLSIFVSEYNKRSELELSVIANRDLPLVSVIVRSIDRDTLPKALDSLAIQTYPNIEVILVNARGASHEHVGTTCGRFPLQVCNAGGAPLSRSAACNVGLRTAQGQYLMFLDDDDWLLPNHVNKLVDALKRKHPQILAAHTGVACVDEQGEATGVVFDSQYDPVRMMAANHLPIHSVLFSRHLLDRGCIVDETLDVLEDWDFWLQVSCHTDILFVPGITAYYLIHDSSGVREHSAISSSPYRQIYHKWRSLWPEPLVLQAMAKLNCHHQLLDELSQRDVQIASLDDAVAHRDQAAKAETASLRAELAAARNKSLSLETDVETLAAEGLALRVNLESAHSRLDYLHSVRVAEQQARELAEERLHAIWGSTSWQLTRPLRALRYLSRGQWGLLWPAVSRPPVVSSPPEAVLAIDERSLGEQEAYTPTVVDGSDIQSATGNEVNNEVNKECAQDPRRFLRELLTDRYDERITARVCGYLDLIGMLERSRVDGREMRAATLAGQLDRIKALVSASSRERPVDVSIIIPAFNHVEHTIACVISILEHTSAHSYEIIIADDCSNDETAEIFGAIGGFIRLLTQRENQGFTRNCNLAAHQASGRWLVMLNNDTLVLDRWLDELINSFVNSEGVGLVGSKILSKDGYLQEAGGIVWSDGSAWNFGRGHDPRDAEFNYLKDVDYCSGASIAVSYDCWQRVGGFDERFRPAYCEDTDLAFSIRKSGYRTLYQPRSELIHHEGLSHGTDVASGLKTYQVGNSRTFFSKWRTVLESDHFPNGQDGFLARDRSRHLPHILFADHYVPEPDRDAGSRTIWDYLRIFVSSGFQVTFWPENLNENRAYARKLQEIGIEIIYGKPKFEQWICENGKYFNYAFLSRAHSCKQFVEPLRAYSKAKILFYGHDIGFLRVQQELAVTNSGGLAEEITRLIEQEPYMWRHADVIYNPGSWECDFIRARVPGKPVRDFQAYIFDDTALADAKNRMKDSVQAVSPQLIFVGGFRHRPNVDGIMWFCREVFPLIREEVPSVTLYVVGSDPPSEVVGLNDGPIKVTGYVPDDVLVEFYRTSAVSVAPLRFGGGVKGKIVEAMRFGLPIVTTSVGLHGLDAASDFLKVADEPKPFAEAVICLLMDKTLRQKNALKGFTYLSDNFSQSSARRLLAIDIPEFRAFADRDTQLTAKAAGERTQVKLSVVHTPNVME